MENIAKKSNTEFILNTFNLKPSKKYGQNFLVDPGIIQSIADTFLITISLVSNNCG